MKALYKPLLELDSYQTVLRAIKNNNTPVLATGVIDVQQAHLIGAIMEHAKHPALVITYSEVRAKAIWQDMLFFDRGNPLFYPAKDILFYSADVRSNDIVQKRAKVVDSFLRGEKNTVVLSIEALFDRLLRREVFARYLVELKEGDIIDISTLTKKLTFMGYERTEIVESGGQYARRGGILDIYSPVEETAYRIELWDDEIDSIRTMDVATQRSIEREEVIRLFPVRELLYEEPQVQDALTKIRTEFEKVKKRLEQKGLQEESERLCEHVGETLERLEQLKASDDVGGFVQYFYEDTVTLLDYLPKDTILYFDEPQRIQEHTDTLQREYEQSIQDRIAMGYMLPGQSTMAFDYTDIQRAARSFAQVLFSSISHTAKGFELKQTADFTVKSTASFQSRFDLFAQELKSLKKEGFITVILSGGNTRCERMVKELYDCGIEASMVEDLDTVTLEKGSIVVASGKVSRGFLYSYIHLAVFSENELLGDGRKRNHRVKKKKGATIQSFSDLKVGDYVVHDNHGIGVFKGLEKIIVDGISKDYMKVSYSDGGSLFVPVNQMDMIQKYIGSGGTAPKLNKLGGQDWLRAKAKVRKAVTIMAEDLVAIYAKRQAAQGFVYTADNLWQKEFEETFPYEETDDQLDAIADVKRDMESKKVMDRLICGDVGYGKTEVAIRAAFKSVQDSKQVAYLVPTTILAQQHYNTFTQRMADYPVRVELLSRFRTAAQQRKTLEGLKNGSVDIVIGTHRLLSKDIVFGDLGLIIVDEEQRFGVAHKEKLKAIKKDVDVLTLTATPIPRTLHMSLVGIRDMSVLEEPPQERHPVQTYVMESNPEFIREAVNRELNRSGQVYYLHNRVGNISETAYKLQKLLPHARISYAHGQMTERELERIMEDFIEGEIDVLVCTTIIETGLDIPNVNTIIIQDADRMGLSQLYQLRGRVGRSNRLAYAYLMYKRDKALKEEAGKRLQTIREFTEFGSGFKIAMRDLEIRGAGNLLGAEQHGHMESVGYDMYCKLLDEEVRRVKGEDIVEEKQETVIDLNVNAFIPDFYIKNQEQRLEIYKKIAAVSSEEAYYDIQEEIEDRFGTLPKSVHALLEVVLIKADAMRCDITSIIQKQKNIIVTFLPEAKINPEVVTRLIMGNKTRYLFTSGTSPFITIKTDEKQPSCALEYVRDMLDVLVPK